MIVILAGPAGELLAWASSVAELPAPPANSFLRELPYDAPPPPPAAWDPVELDWTVPAPS